MTTSFHKSFIPEYFCFALAILLFFILGTIFIKHFFTDFSQTIFFTLQILDALDYIQWRGRVYLNLEPANVLVCSGRSLGKTVQVKLANFETTQTVSKSGTQIKGTYNFDYAGKCISILCHSVVNNLICGPFPIFTRDGF